MSKNNEQDKRMIEVLKSFSKTNEIIKESTREVDEDKLLAEQERLKALATGHLNADFKNENYYVAGTIGRGGQAKTVNTFLDDYTASNTKSTSPKSEPSGLKADEALEISIKRTLKSGAPINNISFYDEVNWNLMNLGFPAVDSMIIKQSIFDMLGE